MSGRIIIFILFYTLLFPRVAFSKSQSRVSSTKKSKFFWGDEKCVSSNSAICENNTDNICFGANIPYAYASLSPVHISQHSSMSNEPTSYNALFGDYSGLPDCWPLFRELVCSIQFAPCENTKVKTVHRDLCFKTLHQCKFLIDNDLWPTDIGNCTNTKIFSDSCTLPAPIGTSLIWNESSSKRCIHPLVYSQFKDGWYLPYCSLNCSSPWLTDSEQEHMHSVVRPFVVIAFVVTLIALLSLRVNNMKSVVENPYGNWIVKDMSFPLTLYLSSTLVTIFFWLIQYIPSARKSFTCRADGSLRVYEIAAEQNVNCSFQFASIYCGIISACYWICVYFWFCYVKTSANFSEDSKKTSIRRKNIWFIVGFVLPISCSIYPFIKLMIETDGVSGICFIGYSNPLMMIIFVYCPVTISCTVSLALLVAGCFNSGSKKCCSTDVNVSPESTDPLLTKNTRPSYPCIELVVLWLCFAILLFASWLLQLTMYNFTQDAMNVSLLSYIKCQIQNPVDRECILENRPDVRLIEMHTVIYFSHALLTDFWIIICGKMWLLWKLIFIKKILEKLRTLCSKEKTKESQPALDGAETSDSSAVTIVERPSKREDFMKRINSRSSVRRRSSPFPRTPSSLKSGSLPSGLNCSFSELPFEDFQTKPQMPPFCYPYMHHPWFPPAMPMFYGPPPFPSPHVVAPTQPASSNDCQQQRQSRRSATPANSKRFGNYVGNAKAESNAGDAGPQENANNNKQSTSNYCYYPHHMQNPWLPYAAAYPPWAMAAAAMAGACPNPYMFGGLQSQQQQETSKNTVFNNNNMGSSDEHRFNASNKSCVEDATPSPPTLPKSVTSKTVETSTSVAEGVDATTNKFVAINDLTTVREENDKSNVACRRFHSESELSNNTEDRSCSSNSSSYDSEEEAYANERMNKVELENEETED